MREIIPLVLAAGLAGPAGAATYQIDLSAIEPVARVYSCFYCGSPSDPGAAGGPLFPVMYFNPGDTIDFGTVTMQAHLDVRDWERSPIFFDSATATSVHPDPFPVYWIEGGASASFDAAIEPSFFYGGTGNAVQSLNLTYTIPDWADSIQIGWGYADGVYVPPVPEPSTWAMLLLGFVLMLGKRRVI